MAKELVVTTIGLKKAEVDILGSHIPKYCLGGRVNEKADVDIEGTFYRLFEDGSAQIFIALLIDLEGTFVAELESHVHGFNSEDFGNFSETEFYACWVDGFKRQHVNRPTAEMVKTDLGLKEPSKREETKKKAIAEGQVLANAVAIGKMIALGVDDEQILRIFPEYKGKDSYKSK